MSIRFWCGVTRPGNKFLTFPLYNGYIYLFRKIGVIVQPEFFIIRVVALLGVIASPGFRQSHEAFGFLVKLFAF
jgi:hypothetical protein